MRHHRPIQAEVLYYPQETTLENGPTFVIPYSLYWTTNHESSEGNFSGPDHLDFFASASRNYTPQSPPQCDFDGSNP